MEKYVANTCFMEICSTSYLIQALASLLAAFLVFNKVWKTITGKHNSSKGKKLPQPSGAWPLIGHLHLLAKGQVPVCRTLGALADENGPIFQIKLGTKRAIVVSSWETVKECLCTNDQVFLNRPASATSKYMCYNNGIFAFGPYGAYWRYVRKIASLELLSNRRLELLKNVRSSEVDAGIKELYKLLCSKGSAMVDMSRWFQTVTLNIMVRMIAGKRYGYSFSGDEKADDYESQRFLKAIHGFMYLSGMFVVSDFIPGIEWLDLQGHIRSMKRNAEELDYFMTGWLEEHIQDIKQEMVEKDQRDFIHALISKTADHDDASIHGHTTDVIIKATALAFVIAGSDTSYLTLIWAFSLVLNHVQVLKNAQEELDIHVGRERWVEESDMKNLVYLQAIIKEAMRLCPPAPLLAPHESMEDCNVAGYFVPKGTQLLVNVWKLHRDSRVWTDPDDFKPERFLTTHAHFDVRGKNFEYIPFSAGRRSCPGISSAMQAMPLTLGRLLQGFNITTPINEPVDMTEGVGLTLPKATPVHVTLKPRLPHALYV